jgi:hypothetical protein
MKGGVSGRGAYGSMVEGVGCQEKARGKVCIWCSPGQAALAPLKAPFHRGLNEAVAKQFVRRL